MTLLVNLSPFLMFAVCAWLALSAKKRFKRTALMAADAQPVENLVALATYDVDETGYWRRSRWVSGLFFAVAFAAFVLVIPIPNMRYSPPVTAAISFAIGGPLFGLFFPAMMRRKVRLITAGLYAGERWIIDPPPANQLVYYQIPCTWINGKALVGGVLYLGRGGLLFVPHKKNRRPSTPVEMTPIDAVRIARVAPFAGNAVQRLLVPRPLEQIEVTWNGVSARFLMPNPADTFLKFGGSLEVLQRIPK
jgi:hypothetical protein